jgi:molybdopterin-guanine dinucleotide biosynthesis protein A
MHRDQFWVLQRYWACLNHGLNLGLWHEKTRVTGGVLRGSSISSNFSSDERSLPGFTAICPTFRKTVDNNPTSLVTVDGHERSVILLTGGSSRRMGSDKARIDFGGSTLLTFQLEQIPREFPVVVVGEPIDTLPIRAEITFTRENPPGAGPVAAIAAGLGLVTTPVIVVLAVDAPFALPRLLQHTLGPNSHALLPREHSGKVQYLAGLYRGDPLRRALDHLGSPINKSMRELTSHLQSIDYLELGAHESQDFMDIDTPQDLVIAQALLRTRPKVTP